MLSVRELASPSKCTVFSHVIFEFYFSLLLWELEAGGRERDIIGNEKVDNLKGTTIHFGRHGGGMP